MVIGALSPGMQQKGHEDDHSPPSTTKVNNGGAIHPHPHNFTLLLLVNNENWPFNLLYMTLPSQK
jgi:hypothetical protein